mgnify:CR=1 FL=1
MMQARRQPAVKWCQQVSSAFLPCTFIHPGSSSRFAGAAPHEHTFAAWDFAASLPTRRTPPNIVHVPANACQRSAGASGGQRRRAAAGPRPAASQPLWRRQTAQAVAAEAFELAAGAHQRGISAASSGVQAAAPPRP